MEQALFPVHREVHAELDTSSFARLPACTLQCPVPPSTVVPTLTQGDCFE